MSLRHIATDLTSTGVTDTDQPSDTVRSLTESKRLLEEARKEINEERERSQLRTKHTFSRLPGFLPREAEIRAIERALDGEPSFTVLFGASSVGKVCRHRDMFGSISEN